MSVDVLWGSIIEVCLQGAKPIVTVVNRLVYPLAGGACFWMNVKLGASLWQEANPKRIRTGALDFSGETPKIVWPSGPPAEP